MYITSIEILVGTGGCIALLALLRLAMRAHENACINRVKRKALKRHAARMNNSATFRHTHNDRRRADDRWIDDCWKVDPTDTAQWHRDVKNGVLTPYD